MRSLCDISSRGFIIDWRYMPDEIGGYCYAEPFEGLTPEEDYQLSKPDDLFDPDDFIVEQLQLMRAVATGDRLRGIEVALSLRDETTPIDQLKPYIGAEDDELSEDQFRLAVATRILEDLERSPDGDVRAVAGRIMSAINSQPNEGRTLMTQDQQHIAAMQRAFPCSIKFHDLSEGRWLRPEHLATEPNEGHDGGAFYYENAEMPPDRFYFETADEAWLDLWREVGEPGDLRGIS